MFTKRRLILVDVFLRMTTPFLLWWNMAFGLIVIAILDAVDGDVLARIGKVRRKWYQQYDKFLDLWCLTITFVFFWTLNFPRDGFWWLLVAVFFVRLVGSILFALTDFEWLLFVFPSVFNWLLVARVVFPQYASLDNPYTPYFFGGLLVVTLWKEWQLHVAKIDMTSFFFPFIEEKKW